MAIFKRPNGYFYLRINTSEGLKRISLETKDERLANEIYQAYLLDRVKRKLIPAPQESRTPKTPKRSSSTQPKKSLTACFMEYLKSCEAQNLSKGVMQSKARLLRLLQKYVKNAAEINQDIVNKLLGDWQAKGNDSKDRYIKDLRAFLNFCIKKRLYSRSDYETLSFPSKSTKARDTVIPENDYQRLLQGARDRDFSLYLQALWETGCRPNEIVSLKKSDIDFDKGIAKIYQSKTKKYKTVYFTDELLDLFRQAPQDELFFGAGKQKEFYSKKFKDLKEALALPKEYCLYAFRHSFGTRMLNKTKDIHLVSKLLGHSDISITAKHYINRDSETIRRQLMEAGAEK